MMMDLIVFHQFLLQKSKFGLSFAGATAETLYEINEEPSHKHIELHESSKHVYTTNLQYKTAYKL